MAEPIEKLRKFAGKFDPVGKALDKQVDKQGLSLSKNVLETAAAETEAMDKQEAAFNRRREAFRQESLLTKKRS